MIRLETIDQVIWELHEWARVQDGLIRYVPQSENIPKMKAALERAFGLLVEALPRDLNWNDRYVRVINPKLEVRRTEKYGLGVFAREEVLAGEKVVVFRGLPVPADSIPMYPEYDEYMEVSPGVFIGPSGCEDDMVNHSCSPNCAFHEMALYALRPIALGEEITFDYSCVIFDEWRIPCLCGSGNCRGFIAKKE